MRTTATRVSAVGLAIASTALAVPSVARLMRARSTSGCPTTRLMAVPMPLWTSAVMATLALATRWPWVSMTTASMLVPPASTPSHSSAAGISLSDQRCEVHVVAEGGRADDGEPGRRAPDRRSRRGDDDDALAATQPLGRDRVARLEREDRDEVRDRGTDGAVLHREQELVLELQTQLAPVAHRLLDGGGTAHEAAVRAALDVDDPAIDEDDGVVTLAQRLDAMRRDVGGHGVADRDRPRERSRDRRLAGLESGHAVQRTGAHAAEARRRAAGHPLGPRVVGAVEHLRVAPTVGEDHRAGRDVRQVHGLLLQLGEGAAHAVGVDEGQADARRPHDRQQPVHARDRVAHEGGDGLRP